MQEINQSLLAISDAFALGFLVGYEDRAFSLALSAQQHLQTL
jgi:hypothetical protein